MTPFSSAPHSDVASGERSKPFLAHVEGLRGIAALYVVAYHAYITLLAMRPRALDALPLHGAFLAYGHSAVVVFIVLSGYVLTLPLVQTRTLPGGLRRFFVRRARRLLPGYYAAFAISIPIWFAALPAYAERGADARTIAAMLVTHALLVHDLSARTIETINGALWTVAVEFQIYIFFATVMLPVWRRFGPIAMVVGANALGFIPTLVAASTGRHVAYALGDACLWFAGSFAFGSLAAIVGRTSGARFDFARSRVPWSAATLLFASIAIVALRHHPWRPVTAQGDSWIVDVPVGATVACAFVAIDARLRRDGRSIVASVLGSLPCVRLGAFSYSLYLIHYPLVIWVVYRLANAPLRSDLVLCVTFCIAIPAIVALAYAFSLAFERPFSSAATPSRSMRSGSSARYDVATR